MSPGQPVAPGMLRGGHLLSAISNGIVKLMREHYGRGPMKAKTYVLDDIVVCVLRGSGFTALEQTMMDSDDYDRGERVIAMREDFQRLMAERYTAMIEELTGRKVIAFLSQAHVDPDITLEMFFVDRPLEGFGAVEQIDGARPEPACVHLPRNTRLMRWRSQDEGAAVSVVSPSLARRRRVRPDSGSLLEL